MQLKWLLSTDKRTDKFSVNFSAFSFCQCCDRATCPALCHVLNRIAPGDFDFNRGKTRLSHQLSIGLPFQSTSYTTSPSLQVATNTFREPPEQDQISHGKPSSTT